MKKSLIVLCALAGIARADYAPPDYLAKPPALPPSYATGAVWRLDLAEAITIAMKQNLNITLARKELEVVRLAGVAAKADLYDPTVTASVAHGSSDAPPPTLQAGLPGSVITTRTDGATVSVGQRLPTGATISLGVSGSRTASDSGAAPLPLGFLTGVTLQINQPLFKGFSTDLDIPRMPILTARIADEAARHDFAAKATTVVQATEAAYWQVVLELYSYNVALKSQKLAEDTVTLTRRQIEAGISQPADLPGAQSTLAQSKLAVLAAEASIETASDTLRLALNLPRDEWQRPLLPTEHPRFEPADVTTEEAALEAAIAHRPDLASANLGLESSALSVRAAQNATLPDISLGLSATALGEDTSLGGSLTQLRENTGWGVMLNLTWTPLGGAAKARARSARIQHDISAGNREALVQSIWSQVRGAIRDERAAALRLTAASEARTLASQSLDIENRRYAMGSSSNLTIATRQHDLAEAELAELQALLHHQNASTGFLVATGQLLDHRHIVLSR
jgi:outer membrane protein